SIKCNQTVTKIITQGNEGKGISVNGEADNLEYDRFVVNGDFPIAEKLVEMKNSRSYTPSVGTLVIYLGIDGHLNTDHM
ncbi:hypothetical protein, partial [Pseudomonas sp. 2822-15]|uniref:hypothetical protein n=1 Tax=Pseudomonas sp. 2822-15 TaxID=1712677 RepID=UPI001C457B44